ncbi:Cna B-type domain-containing protein [Butyrivibrio sp. VCD2006]|uniref:Cna B-type domain-containing protein n=1 Tax=Butyrivibrio sp. VCD2006 TaxID=1280664 RepID=UPI00040AE116|nr:Cna B-type domain-containing protein [Butyrivibrio sp. VCD2006]
MKMFEKVKKLIIGAATLSMSAMLLLPGAVAHASDASNNGLGTIDLSRDATLSVYYNFEATGDIPGYGQMPGVKVNAYKLASISETGQFSLVAPFDSLGLEVTDVYSIADQEKWNKIITEASKCIVENNVLPSYSAISEADGFARLGTVDKGLYLGISDKIVIDEIEYKYWDFLSVVPGPNNLDVNEGNAWDGTWSNAIYDVIAIPKREAIRLEGDPEEFNVYKQWVDEGASDRPTSISVNIFCDGTLLETVQLSGDNNWQYSWRYERGHNFSVEEVLNSNLYTPSVSRNANSFVIVNTRNPETPETPPDKPKKPKKPKNPESPKNPDNPSPEPESNEEYPDVLGAIRDFIGELPEVLGARRLPQTGQLWWPIPILAILGIVLIFLGFRSEKRRK